jgi:pilus assembly protein FimV
MGANKGEKGSFMFRKSALAMAMLGTLTAGTAVALGLGEIELKSALNQPLNAEVELLSATREELQELKVEIASPEAFASAGIDRPLFLNKLQFDVKTGPDGKAVVHITSRDVVREPFLDFLLELSWSKGRLLREYTVLVDPPVTMPAPAPALQAPAARAPARTAAPATSARVTHTAQLPPVSVAPGEYTTQRNDTLWQIAQQVRPDAGVSMEQTMLGLLRTNPEAFSGNNINNLKAGYVLRVPDREEFTRISRAEALRETRRHYAEWREAQDVLAPAQTTAGAEASAPAAGGEAPEARLELVAPDAAEAGVQGDAAGEAAGLEALEKELMIANEALEAQRRQGEEMSSRVSALEEQIQNMQRLIQLKDDELARLQAQVGEQVGMSAEGPAEAAPADDGVNELTPTTDAAADPSGADQVAGSGMETAEPAVEQGATAPADGADMPAAAGELVQEPAVSGAGVFSEDQAFDPGFSVAESLALEDSGSAPAESASAPAESGPEMPVAPDPSMQQVAAPEDALVAPQPSVTEPSPAPGFVDRLLANPLWLGAGAAALVVAGFLGLRRRREGDSEFQESILQAARQKSPAASDSEILDSAAETVSSTTTASSLLSEFAVSDMGAMKSDGEADPLAEADVYLAYGRYQQAEDLIKDALRSNPDNTELDLKLLEVYLAARNQAGFDEHAQLLLGRLENSDDPVWEKVAEMGRDISPDNPLYQSGDSVPGASEEADETVFAAGAEAAEPVETSEEDAQPLRQEVPETAAGLEFENASGFDSSGEADEFRPDSLEFTPPEAAFEASGVSEEAAFEVSGVYEEAADAAMDSIEPDRIEVEQDNTLEFDLEGLDLGGDEEADLPGDGELADLDEVSTKLDLARAYLDMGDPDGARSILDEVIEEGSDDQKTEAEQILAKIA